jgi:hypothetical protein
MRTETKWNLIIWGLCGAALTGILVSTNLSTVRERAKKSQKQTITQCILDENKTYKSCLSNLYIKLEDANERYPEQIKLDFRYAQRVERLAEALRQT